MADAMDKMAKDFAASLAEVQQSMSSIQQQLAEARGGWRILLMVGGASATVGAVIAKVAVWWAKTGAPGP